MDLIFISSLFITPFAGVSGLKTANLGYRYFYKRTYAKFKTGSKFKGVWRLKAVLTPVRA